jgi:hypothetical protein
MSKFLGGTWSTYPSGSRHHGSYPIHFSLSPTTTPFLWWPVGGISGERSRAGAADGDSFLPCSKNRSCSRVTTQLSSLLRPCRDPPSCWSSKSRQNLASVTRHFGQGWAARHGARGGRSSSSRRKRRPGGAARRGAIGGRAEQLIAAVRQSSSSLRAEQLVAVGWLAPTRHRSWPRGPPLLVRPDRVLLLTCFLCRFLFQPAPARPTCICADNRHRGG